MAEALTATLQENVITILAHSDEHGKIVANIIDPNLFEGEYRIIAERCVDYWRRHGEAPKLHTPDLVADVLEDAGNKRANTYRRILTAMYELSVSINAGYVMQQLQSFTRMQKIKAAILKSAEQLNSKQETAISEVEDIWNELLRVREANFDPGMRLTDVERTLDYLETVYAEFQTGIPEFDSYNIVPYRNAVFMLLAATGRGKSWALIHLGKHALRQRKKVVHITLEMVEEEVVQRYYQSLFAVAKREKEAEITTMELDRFHRLIDLGRNKVEAEFTFESSLIRDELEGRLSWEGRRYENLIIKKFDHAPTVPELEAYLDNLEVTEKFIPDMLILDYLGLMKLDMRNPRLSLGAVGKDFRSLCIRRNMAGVTAQQISREGAKARLASHTHISEDWSLTNTADIIVTMSATDAEVKLGLARLHVPKVRGERGNIGVLLTQNYHMGQFALESAPLNSKYFDHLDKLSDEYDTDEVGDDEEDD